MIVGPRFHVSLKRTMDPDESASCRSGALSPGWIGILVQRTRVGPRFQISSHSRSAASISETVSAAAEASGVEADSLPVTAAAAAPSSRDLRVA